MQKLSKIDCWFFHALKLLMILDSGWTHKWDGPSIKTIPVEYIDKFFKEWRQVYHINIAQVCILYYVIYRAILHAMLGYAM